MKRLLIFLMLTVVVIAAFTGCRLFRRPLPPIDEEEQRRVEIPAEISRGEGVEPRLRVYMADRSTVEEMDFEQYLAGVVAAEMDVDWPQEALAAQAIIARTFTLQKIAEQGTLPNRDAHASTDIEEFQAYDADRINDNVRQAVQNTRGVVAVHDGEFVRAWFSAYCGGRNAAPTVGLAFQGDDPPYLRSVECPCYEFIDEEERAWSASFSKEQIRRAVSKVTGDDPGDFDSMTVANEAGGRAVTFRVGDVEVPAPELRLAVGSTEMRSTWVDEISVSGNQVKMSGRGYGHGVGLCQWGANAWAERHNRKAEQIVMTYFPGVSLQQLWD